MLLLAGLEDYVLLPFSCFLTGATLPAFVSTTYCQMWSEILVLGSSLVLLCFFTSIFVKPPGNVTMNGFQSTAFKQGKEEKKLLLCRPPWSSAVPVDNAVVDIRSLKFCCCSAVLVWQWKLTLCDNLYLLSHSVMLHNSYNDCLVTAKDQHQS